MAQSTQQVVIFGASIGGKRAWRHHRRRYRILGFCDNDAKKWGGNYCGLPVGSPESLKCSEYDKVIIASCYYMEIFEQLAKLGVNAQKIEVLDPEILCGEHHNRSTVWVLFAGALILGFALYGVSRFMLG